MQGTQKPPASKRRSSFSPRLLCILGFVFTYLAALAIFAPQASAATLSAPGGNVADPVVREVTIARPAVVRIVTMISGQLTVRFSSTASATFPVNGGSYPIEMSGSGAFISAHGDILTADHVVNPPRDQSLNDALYQYAAQDVADYINAHFQVSAPYSPSDAYSVLSSGSLPSTPSYGQASSQVYLSTSYAGDINSTKLETVPAADHAAVDKIEAQSSVNANDEAIVHVSGMDNMPNIQLGDSSQVAELDNLTIIGYPGLADLSEAPTDFLTSSINKVYVSALKKTDAGTSVIQVGGNVEHGDSGGPALDDQGNIVGIVSFGYSGTNGDYGQTSFLQISNNAETLIKSAGISTAPGAFERSWAQAMDDYSSTDSGHWQKASQELQNVARAYPGFQGIATYLNYAQNQANHEQGVSGSGIGASTVLVIVLVVVLLLILGFVFYMLFRRNARAVVVTPGGAQYPSNAYGAYPQQSGVYPPTAATYGTSGIYAQPAPGTQPVPGIQQSVPAGAVYPNYTSPAAYGEFANQVPQTPQVAIGATPLPQPAQNAAFSLPSAQTPWPVEPEPVRPASFWRPPTREANPAPVAPSTQEPIAPAKPIARSIQEPIAPAKPISNSLSDVMGKSASYALPADQAETLSARTLDVPPGETRLPSGDSWPTVAGDSAAEEDKTVAGQPSARAFSVPRRPAAETAASEELETNASNPSTKMAPCGHINPPGVRFCRVCGQPVPPDAPTVSNGNGL